MKTQLKKILNLTNTLIQYIKTKAPLLISSAAAACALLLALLPTKAWAFGEMFPHSPWNQNHNYKPSTPNPILDPINNAFAIALVICIVLYIIFYLKNKIEDIITARKKKKNKNK